LSKIEEPGMIWCSRQKPCRVVLSEEESTDGAGVIRYAWDKLTCSGQRRLLRNWEVEMAIKECLRMQRIGFRRDGILKLGQM
jgi:hypothetical protein